MRTLHLALAVLTASVLFLGPPASGAEKKTPPALERARSAMLARDYKTAVDLLAAHLKAGPSDADETSLLLARAQALAGARDKAIATLDGLLADFPKSPFSIKAVFLKADLLVEGKRTDEALKIYEEQARRAVSPARSLEMAGVYLKFADGFFEPGDEVKRPDWASANLFYGKAMEMGLPADKEAEVVLRRARALKELRRTGEAWNLIEDWRKAHPGHGKDAELAVLQGELLLDTGDPVRARRLFADVLAQNPPDDVAVRARFGVARSHRLPSPPSATELELGIKALRDIIERHPRHPEAPKAAYQIGASYMNLGLFDEACKELERFLASPLAREGVEEVPDAKQLLGLGHFRRKEYGAAIRVWRGFLADHPAHGLWTGVQRRVIDAEYAIGAEHYASKKIDEARDAWDGFLESHPLDERCRAILLLYGKADHEAKRFEAAVAQWEKLVSKYPGTNEASEGLFLIGKTQEEDLKAFSKALEAYRKLDFGPFAGAARERIEALERQEMLLRTERIFRTNEKPAVKVSVRNIKELEFRAWSVDLESYFRKMHTAGGVQELDVPLIEPDHTWKVEVQPFEPFRETELEISMPFQGAGVWAVNVTGAELEATTVVVRSDLALIIKGSRQNLLVLSLDMVTGKPVAEAKILVSDGSKILLESKTDREGILLAEPEGIASATSLRVLGAAGASWASNTLDVGGLPVAAGLSRRAHLFTDRPAYRPGDRVHLKGIVREVKKGAYDFKAGTEYGLEVISSRGQLVRKAKAKLSSFGTLSWTFDIPANAPIGRCRIFVSDAKGLRFSHAFRVVEYKTPKLHVKVNVENPVCYRGETVKGTVAVTTFYGDPAPGRKLEISFGSLPPLSGTTDGKGEFPFSFETREFRETQTVALYCRIHAEGIQGSANVHISSTGFNLKLSTLRAVYLANEPLDLEVEAIDMAGKPLSVPVQVSIHRLEDEAGRIHEVPVQTLPVTTDPSSGKRKATLSLKDSGRHRFRARARDRFGNTITAEAEVMVSGKDDEVKVRILSDREEYRMGESPMIDVHNRLGAKTVLLTFEGERVFRHMVKRLLPGMNTFRIDMDSTLAPNFILSATVLDGSDLHEARREFRVTRKLKVSVRALSTDNAPGGKARIEIVTEDPMGNPVAAEVALAMVDSAYLSLFPWDEADPAGRFFIRRGEGCGSVSTNTFSFEAQTRTVLEALRDEEQRQRQQEERKQQLKRLVDFDARGGPQRNAEPQDAEYAEEEDSLAQDKSAESSKALKKESQGYVAYGRAGKDAGFFADAPAKANFKGIGGGAGGSFSARQVLSFMEDATAGLLETGYWNPRIVTGRKGRVVIEIDLPANVTRWQFLAVGTTQNLLLGTAQADLTARKSLVAELKSPASLVEGDKAKLRARVRNLTEKPVKATLALAWAAGGDASNLGAETVEVPAGGEGEAVFEVTAGAPADGEYTLTASAGGFADRAVERVRIHPRGTEIRLGWGGTETRERTVRVDVPEKDYAWRAMAVTVGASLGASLLEIGEGAPAVSWCREPVVFFSAADRGLLALAKRDFLRSTGREKAGEWTRYESVVEAAVAELAVAQNSDGGFGWTTSGSSNAYASCQAVRFLARAAGEGFPVDAKVSARARAYLTRAFSSTEDNAVKAASLWALAHLGGAEFAFVNRLFRIRESLTPWAQAALADTLVRMDRREMAAQAARVLEARFLRAEAPPAPADQDKRGAWTNRWVDSDRAEVLALSLSALCKVLPGSPRIADGMDQLANLKVGSVWATGKATAAAAEALGLYLTKVKVGGDRYRVTVTVNGKILATFDMDRSAGRRTVEVAPGSFKSGENAVAFRMEGVGRYEYRIDFLGRTRAEDDSQRNRFVRIERDIQPRSILVKGLEAAPGFSCAEVEREDIWTNRLSHLPEGQSGLVEIRYSAREGEGYLILEESLPGGVVLQAESISGDFSHYEVRPGRILFFLREGARAGKIRYRFYGTLPGLFSVPGPRVWSAVEPMRLSTGPSATLAVIGADDKSPDPYRPTPDELLALGRDRFEAKDHKEAMAALANLFENFRLRPATFAEAARMLLFCAVELERAPEIVKYFEILKERLGSVEIPFDKTMVIASAYRSLGEDELALQIYQGLLEAAFLKESNVAADLEDQERYLDSIAFMEKLLLEYPDLPILVSSRFALTQSVYNRAEEFERGARRAELIARAGRMLRAFLGDHPDHSLSDQAGFSLANAYLALKAGKPAGELAETLVRVHAKSPFLDELHYLAALAFFRAHEWDRALHHALKVVEGRFHGPDGTMGESAKKHLAMFILGQIHHARGDFAKAAEQYEKVADRFGDARASLEQFRWKRLLLPEITLLKTGEAVKVKVTHRNVSKLKLLVYPVDLMKLYLMRKNLDDVASVNLAGIKPFHEKDVDVSAGPEYRDRETEASIPVAKKGAYLVVAKGDSIEASGLVVLSDLKLEVQEDTGSGRLRVTVQNEKKGSFEEDAHVKVVGSESEEFVSGDTDLRGVFEAGGLIGNATVIVKKETSYAFFRGESVHRPAEAMRRRARRGEALFGRAARPSAAAQVLTLAEQVENQELLEEALALSNKAIQQKNIKDLHERTRTKQKGMQASQARRK